jgi:uncharacterized damage-inducible protein DinB
MHRMLKVGCCVMAGCMVSGLALGQAAMGGMHMAQAAAPAGPAGPAGEVQRSYEGLKKNILKAADNMPADAYTFKPEPDIRTFARIVNHVTEAQLHSCAAVTGTKDLPKVPAETADKAAVVEALRASFAECDKAYASATDANMTEMFAMGPAKRSRMGLLWGNVSHDNEQYSALALYMRLKGLTPPSSEK